MRGIVVMYEEICDESDDVEENDNKASVAHE
jgi:hypothetical protein